MVEDATLRPCPDGGGFQAMIRLNGALVRGAMHQQGWPETPSALAKAEERRLKAIADCVDRVNATLPSAERIRTFEVLE